MPIDAAISSESEAEVESVDVASVLARMDTAKNRLNIVILDACRDNPFARSFRSPGRGLASIDAPSGTMIAYATAPGRVARDGDGANGLYTSELLKAVQVPGLRLEDVFKRVRQSVQQQTRGEQVPWEASSLVGEFVFAVPAAAPSSGRLEGTTWHGRSSAGDAYEVVFEAEGRLRFTPLLGTRATSGGTWGQKGDLVYFEINNGHSESSGIRRGDVIEGTGRNVTGQTWTWTLTRMRAE